LKVARASTVARWRRATGVATLFSVVVCACATPAPSPLTRDAEALPDAELTRRVDFIEQRLEAARTPAAIWHWSWLAVNGGAGVALNTGLALADDSSSARASAIVQAVCGALGVAGQYADPMNARHGAEPLRALPDETREQKLQKLERAEVILQENAARSSERTSWVLHLGSLVASTAAGLLVLAFGGRGARNDALITGGTTLVGGELFLWTTPSGPVRDLEDYRAWIESSGRGAAPTSRKGAAPAAQALFTVHF
jgi:hypothetical protein